jgi:hypothetical protein
MELITKPVDDRAGECFLTFEVIVKGSFGHPGFLQDAIQSHQMDAMPVK